LNTETADVESQGPTSDEELLPVLVARLTDITAVADVLRTALVSEVTTLPLDEPPLDNVVHALELHAPELHEPFVVSATPLGDSAVRLCPLDDRETRRIRRFLDLCKPDPLVGTVLGGRYRIERLVGTGAMGSVYRAHHLRLDKPIAIKVLNAAIRNDEAFAARFLAEARAASRLDHPGILRVLDFGDDDELLYMVMELLDGDSLEREAERGAMPIERALDIVARIGDALGAAHEKGVVHRDIKPDNVMLSGDRVVVCDFGIAQTSGDGGTLVGGVCGTPEFMAPEQGRGEEVGPPADVYSAGIILFRLLTGRLPFVRGTLLGTVLAHVTDPFPRASLFRTDLPASVERVLDRACAKDPAARPANGKELATVLRGCLAELQSHSHSHSQSAERPTVPAALREALDGDNDLQRIQALSALRRLRAIDAEVVAKLADFVGPISGASMELRVAAAVALGDVEDSARGAAIDALSAALLPRSGGVVGLMSGASNDELVFETVARVLIALAGDEGRKIVATRAQRARPSVRARLEALSAPERRIA
jgi:serine/threonine protein kinase